MPLSDKAEEILETLWVEQFEKGRERVNMGILARGLRGHVVQDEMPPSATLEGEEIQELLTADLVELREEGEISLTPAGAERGKHVVRNHRLAERLLTDVLDLPESLGDAAACRFEHVLKRGIDERICTLLGHPRSCPHGRPIPPGACCEEKRDTSIRVVAPLSELEEGASGTVAYIHTAERGQVERLLALGVLPGQPIVLMQRFPSYLFRVGQTEVAVDEELA
ncbi:MAG: transcriptional regulator, partial [Armatimonadetes bacterium]|nr:transcriptional regulator [Armatimonadota bacterium]NIM24538.1 transcriptional regulator [Armatimonadota bacterium]NIM68412.1 transcriptional regulator [Armatimonadota bacterium]NIM76798.1 transcriptional regulator [Armatimonadota bacterium]NIN06611.1 transcriptional regulator [Armatimonadota bacterium]